MHSDAVVRAAGTGAAAVAVEDPERLGFVTLAQFLGQLPALGVVHDGGNGQERLRWVEPSELEDPTPYLLDGEFLLTAGLPFVGGGGSEEAVDAYVRRLVQARVGALGFGLEPYFDAVPEAVVRACRQHNLTLVAIPESLPFAALGLEFSRLLESDNAKTFRQLADTSRQLMRAVLSARPEHELLAALVQRVPVWAVLVGADGRVRARGSGPSPGPQAAGAAAGTVPGVDSADLQPLLARLLAGSGPRVEMDSFDAVGSSLVFGYPLRSTRDANLGAHPRHGRPADPGPEQRCLHRGRAAGTAGPPAHQWLPGPEPAGHGAAAAPGERGLRICTACQRVQGPAGPKHLLHPVRPAAGRAGCPD